MLRRVQRYYLFRLQRWWFIIDTCIDETLHSHVGRAATIPAHSQAF